MDEQLLLAIALENNYKRLQVDEICGRDAEGVGVPLDVVLHDVAVRIVHQVGVGCVCRGHQIPHLKEESTVELYMSTCRCRE